VLDILPWICKRLAKTRFYLTLKTEDMFHQVFKNIDDVLWKEAGCTTELDYTEQTSWMPTPPCSDRPTASGGGDSSVDLRAGQQKY
jgi:hypothetical protein